ncbi:MAG: tRNA adenosine(34) deaminase TadA [Thermaerobacter sp.]|nr:tRNA adenosine(34) deaminase TadA [Thermaerobacter sp.]MDA8145473.1 tRNA adenosine(34) deaminase TadA [Thermaerobacter sp.]
MDHAAFMGEALAEAELAFREGEVPIGAVLVRQGRVLARDHNRTEQERDPTAHAEVLVLRRAGRLLGDWRLEGTVLYVTVEPCPMCAGALVLARVPLVVYGARDPKWGAGGSLYNLLQERRLNHRAEVIEGVREQECAALLRRFFRERSGVEG